MKLNTLQVVALVGLVGCALGAPSADRGLCSTPGCKEIASIFKDSMNASVNPCEDFYQFSCGGWMKHHDIPAWKSATGVTQELEDVQRGQIQKLLESFNLAKDTQKSSFSVAYAASVYQKCLALGSAPESIAHEYLRNAVQSVLGPVKRDWTIGTPAKAGLVSPPWYQLYSSLVANGGPSPIFSIGVFPDPKNVTNNIINLDPADLGLGDKELANLTSNPRLITAYKTYMEKSVKLICHGQCGGQALVDDIAELVQLESDLANARMSAEDERDPESTYNKLTLDELAAKTKFDWLNKIFLPIWKHLGVSAPITGQTHVLLSDLGYYVKAVEILAKTTPRVLDNYFDFSALDEYSTISSEAFRDIAFEMSKVSSGTTKRTDRSQACLGLVNSNLNWALGRLFVEHEFSQAEKDYAAMIINEVQSAYGQLIQKNQWLDEETKKASLSKLNHIRKNVAYPAWLLNNTQLDAFHSLQNRSFAEGLLAEKNFIQSLVDFSVSETRDFLNQLGQPIDVDQSWPMGPFIVNAAYQPEQNSITIPAGQLKTPFFNHNFPFAVNYGNLGALVGHELTHSLDDEGRQFDEHGNFKAWWGKAAIEKFENRSQCFIDQYSAVKDPVSGLNLNGENTLGENLADNGGLNEAFLAYKNHQTKKGPSPRLADLPKYTSDQLFWIAYGFSWCSSLRPEAIRNQIEYDVHSPAQYRVNVPVGNSKDFAQAFNCPAGTPMNPKEKCLLW